MKKIKFEKYSGAGNDFVIIDAIKGINYKMLAVKMCDRTNGIGADGLLVLDKSKKANYKMRIINADGSEAEMCGNGARCMAAYIAKNKLRAKTFTMQTIAGIIGAQISSKSIQVHLSDPTGYKEIVPLSMRGKSLKVSYIDTGVPHTIIYVDNLASINVKIIGEAIRYHKKFHPRGTNVNFVEQINQNLIEVRTYERGVEDETKACGTGSVASAIVSYIKSRKVAENQNIFNAKMKVKTKSKEILEVSFDITNNTLTNVWLKGSANRIAKGEYYLY